MHKIIIANIAFFAFIAIFAVAYETDTGREFMKKNFPSLIYSDVEVERIASKKKGARDTFYTIHFNAPDEPIDSHEPIFSLGFDSRAFNDADTIEDYMEVMVKASRGKKTLYIPMHKFISKIMGDGLDECRPSSPCLCIHNE